MLQFFMFIVEPIEIVKQPADTVTVEKGGVLELEVQAVGFPYPRYQWFKEKGTDWDMLDKEKNCVLRINDIRYELCEFK